MSQLRRIDPQEIRTALKATLDAVMGDVITVHANPPDSPSGNHININAAPEYITYYDTFGGSGMSVLDFELEIVITGAKRADVQVILDDFLGVATPHSIVSTLFDDPSLGGYVQTCQVLNARWSEADWTATIPVRIYAKKGGN